MGSKQDSIQFLFEGLEGLISRYKADRERHKKLALNLKVATAILAASAMVLLGWIGSPFLNLFKNIALTLNAFITIFAASEAFFESRKFWVRETIVLSQLKNLQRDLKFEIASGKSITEGA